MDEPTFNPNRQLCPDGSCVGVIGSDGRCTVCARAAGAAADVEVDDDSRTAEPSQGAPTAATDGFDPARRLCDDGSCVGVVGPDGVCGACGRKAD